MKCKILKEIGTLTKTSKGAKKLQLIEWDGRPAVYDLRTWLSDGKATSGVTFSKEDLLRIVELVEAMENEEDEELPINQPIEEEEDDDEVIFSRATKKVEPKKTEIKKEKVVEVAKTDTHYTYDDCEKKLDSMFKKYADVDAYIWLNEEIKKQAKEDDSLVQNIMRESRTIDNMTLYARDKTYEKFNSNYTGAINDNEMLEYCIEYLNAKEEPKKSVAKSKPTVKTTKKTTTKKTTSKKTTSKRVVKPLEIFDDEE